MNKFKTVVIHDLPECIDMINHNFRVQANKQAKLNSKVCRRTTVGIIFGLACLRKFQEQKKEIRELKDELKSLKDEHESLRDELDNCKVDTHTDDGK